MTHKKTPADTRFLAPPSAAPVRIDSGLPVVSIRPDLESPLAKGHPWIYRDHLPAGSSFAPGTWVKVVCGSWSGIGIFDPSSPLAVRVYSKSTVPDAAWFEERVARAHRRRSALLANGETTAYRLINGEGDGLGGVVVDVYGPFAALRLDCSALEVHLPWIVSAVERATSVKGICRKGEGGLEVLSGRAPPERLIVSEHGVRFYADIASGQKTGLFLDHRENRRQLEQWCQNARVLNLFSYTGGFSLYAARGGARQVLSVDRAGDAMARARDNVELNGLNPEIFEYATADAIEYLQKLSSQGRQFDVVISDPPTFARNRTQRKKAQRAYERLHALALEVLAPGGLLAAASCTSQIDSIAFKDTIAVAAARCRRTLQIVAENGQAPDHPVLVAHPEGRYLKFVALRSIDD